MSKTKLGYKTKSSKQCKALGSGYGPTSLRSEPQVCSGFRVLGFEFEAWWLEVSGSEIVLLRFGQVPSRFDHARRSAASLCSAQNVSFKYSRGLNVVVENKRFSFSFRECVVLCFDPGPQKRIQPLVFPRPRTGPGSGSRVPEPSMSGIGKLWRLWMSRCLRWFLRYKTNECSFGTESGFGSRLGVQTRLVFRCKWGIEVGVRYGMWVPPIPR